MFFKIFINFFKLKFLEKNKLFSNQNTENSISYSYIEFEYKIEYGRQKGNIRFR